MAQRTRKLHSNAYAPSREAHVERMVAAGLKHLHRPQDANDPYNTVEAVRAWAETQVDSMLRKGLLIIGVQETGEEVPA